MKPGPPLLLAHAAFWGRAVCAVLLPMAEEIAFPDKQVP